MNSGTFYAIGVGPGDPELMTLKAVRLLRKSPCIYVPTSRLSTQTWVANVVQMYAANAADIHTVSFSLGADRQARQKHWQQTADAIIGQLQLGKDVAFVSLGDPLLYSTCIYLLRALQEQWPQVPIEIVPGISAYAHCAALTNFAIGAGEQPVTIIPTVTAINDLQSAINKGGTLVLMKVGRHLQAIIDLLEENKLIEQAVFIARAGLPDQRIETNLRCLRGADPAAGNLAIILVHTENIVCPI